MRLAASSMSYLIDVGADGVPDVVVFVPGSHYAGLDDLVAQQINAGPDSAIVADSVFNNREEYWLREGVSINRRLNQRSVGVPPVVEEVSACYPALLLHTVARLREFGLK